MRTPTTSAPTRAAKGGASIVANDVLRERMAKGFTAFNQVIPALPAAALPTVTYTDAMTLHFGARRSALPPAQRAHRQRHARTFQAATSSTPAAPSAATEVIRSSTSARRLALPLSMMRRERQDAAPVGRTDQDPCRRGDPASTATLKATRDMLVTLRAPGSEAHRRRQERRLGVGPAATKTSTARSSVRATSSLGTR